MDRVTFLARSETFGFDTDSPWALPALRLVYAAPRAYLPLVEAWETRYPGTRAALDKLVAQGFVTYQGGVIYDTRSNSGADRESRKAPRYRSTWKGHELATAATEDLRVLEDRFPRTASHNLTGVLTLLQSFDLAPSHRKYGLSAAHVTDLCGMSDRTVKWWIRRLIDDKYLTRLTDVHADVREVVPPHWRPTRALSKQLASALSAFTDESAATRREFRLSRSRYLEDIDPARVGISGATDFDHDVQCQRILAVMLASPRSLSEPLFNIEPRFAMYANLASHPSPFGTGDDVVYYQPDAELRERDNGVLLRSVVEYERFQSRRDAWSHIERFLAYLKDQTLPMEAAVLRFVVDSKRREASYRELIEAFADYAIDHPERIPANPITLAVSSVERLVESHDALDPSQWHRLQVPGSGRADTNCVPVLHTPKDSPYNDYFARGPVASS
jgi:hypothetical protein